MNTVLGSTRAARQLGAESAVDFRKDSYSEALLDFSAVVDTLGREKEGAQRMLKEAKGAAYVSLQPKVLKVRRNAIEGTRCKHPPYFSGLILVLLLFVDFHAVCGRGSSPAGSPLKQEHPQRS